MSFSLILFTDDSSAFFGKECPHWEPHECCRNNSDSPTMPQWGESAKTGQVGLVKSGVYAALFSS